MFPTILPDFNRTPRQEQFCVSSENSDTNGESEHIDPSISDELLDNSEKTGNQSILVINYEADIEVDHMKGLTVS